MSIIKTVGDCQQISTGTLLIINNCILDLPLGNQCCLFIFDAYSKDEIGRMSTTGTSVLLNFDS